MAAILSRDILKQGRLYWSEVGENYFQLTPPNPNVSIGKMVKHLKYALTSANSLPEFKLADQTGRQFTPNPFQLCSGIKVGHTAEEVMTSHFYTPETPYILGIARRINPSKNPKLDLKGLPCRTLTQIIPAGQLADDSPEIFRVHPQARLIACILKPELILNWDQVTLAFVHKSLLEKPSKINEWDCDFAGVETLKGILTMRTARIFTNEQLKRKYSRTTSLAPETAIKHAMFSTAIQNAILGNFPLAE